MRPYIKPLLIALFSTAAWGAEGQQPVDEWWKKNPLSEQNLSQEWQQHVELTYSYARINKTEQYEETTHDGQLYGALRKARWTNHTVIAYASDQVSGSGDNEGLEIDDEAGMLDNFLMYAIDPNWVGEVGYTYAFDNTRYVDNRHTLYAGFGYMLQSGSNLFSFFAAAGVEDVEYSVDTDNDGGPLIYAKQSYSRPITGNITFNEDFAYIVFTDDTDIYRTELNLNVNVPISENFSLVIAYNHQYDSTPLTGLSKRQNQQSVGLKLSF